MATGDSADSLTLPADPAVVSVARRFVGERLEAASVNPEVIASAVLLASELVTNAVLHAGTALQVRVHVAGSVRVEVKDGSAELPQRRRRSDESILGRGLELVEAVATDFGVIPLDAHSKIVWFALGEQPSAGRDSWGHFEGREAYRHVVELQHLPVALYEAMRDQYEAMLREYSLEQLQLANDALLQEIGDGERARLLIVEAFAAWKSSLSDDEPVPSHVDLQVLVPEERVAGFAALTKAVRGADSLVASGGALMEPPLPEIVWLRDWVLAEFASQLAGGPSAPWRLPEDDGAHDVSDRLIDADTLTEALVFADAANRIVGISPAATELLWWPASELIGRRLTALIPRRFREAHLAGFSRHLLGHRGSPIGQPMQLPALRRDGREIDVTIVITHHENGNFPYFRAVLTPAREIAEPR